MRGLLLLRGAVRAPRGSRLVYPSFPFVLPGSVVWVQGAAETTQEVFLPTWNVDRPRTLGEFQAQVRSFQARVGRQDFASGAAGFRRAVAGRAITGGFRAFHRFVLEPRKPSRQKRQRQAVSRGITKVGPAWAVRDSLRLLLAPLDDSGWLDNFRFLRTDRNLDQDSERLARAKTRFDASVHSAVDVSNGQNRVNVLKALWDLQLGLWAASKRRKGENMNFRPAPLLEGLAWRRVLSGLLEQEPAARLGWALASLGWIPVQNDNGQLTKRPIIEQLLPCQSDGRPRHRVRQLGKNPSRDFATLLWRWWLDTASLPVLPAMGTRPVGIADVAGLLSGDVSAKDLQRYFLAFLVLDGGGGSPPQPLGSQPMSPCYAALRLWLDLSAGQPRASGDQTTGSCREAS